MSLFNEFVIAFIINIILLCKLFIVFIINGNSMRRVYCVGSYLMVDH